MLPARTALESVLLYFPITHRRSTTMITKEIAAIIAEQQKSENVQKRIDESEKKSPSLGSGITREIDLLKRR